jgi:hypothetical protein
LGGYKSKTIHSLLYEPVNVQGVAQQQRHLSDAQQSTAYKQKDVPNSKLIKKRMQNLKTWVNNTTNSPLPPQREQSSR